ncbi:hypothetical protein B7494_g1329 [Chlorociboria aeruginascens]|nr:hypothetical protein B7494_g1329 [Chlorociboria aeruginascens]
MSVGFGFSVGDFIAALELVATVVDALRESGEASSRYRELVRQLYALETVLLRVKRLEFDETQYSEHAALQHAASQCQLTIDGFWKKIQKYQVPLTSRAATSRLKEGWMKIRWAVCKKEDVNAFKMDLTAHTESIQLLLTTIQISRTHMHEKNANDRQTSFSVLILSPFQLTVSSGMEKAKQILAMTSKILHINIQVFQTVMTLQDMITRIPSQVERQQPVYLIDALGKRSPFHLEFIRSAEALTAVLQANFSKKGHARKMVEKGEFVIQNSLTRRDINLHDDWDHCFHPGQQVDMSLVFQQRWQAGSSCPGCGTACTGSNETDVNCPNCYMTFRRIINIEDEESSKPYVEEIHQLDISTDDKPRASFHSPQSGIQSASDMLQPQNSTMVADTSPATRKRKRKREYAHDDDLESKLQEDNIRRVRIKTISRGMTEKCKVFFGYFEEGTQPDPAFCCGFRTGDDEDCLIVEFEDSKSSALCETISDQLLFKQGGLFQTELVKADSVDENDSLQITWMEEDEVQMYLRFHKAKDRDMIWRFISSANKNWRIKKQQPSPILIDFETYGAQTTPKLIKDNSSAAPLLGFMNLDPSENRKRHSAKAKSRLDIFPEDILSPNASTEPLGFPTMKTVKGKSAYDPYFDLFPGTEAQSRQFSSIGIEDSIATKRTRNSAAARKSRRRKMERFEELEYSISKLEAERDHWKDICMKRFSNIPKDLEREVELAHEIPKGVLSRGIKEREIVEEEFVEDVDDYLYGMELEFEMEK